MWKVEERGGAPAWRVAVKAGNLFFHCLDPQEVWDAVMEGAALPEPWSRPSLVGVARDAAPAEI